MLFIPSYGSEFPSCIISLLPESFLLVFLVVHFSKNEFSWFSLICKYLHFTFILKKNIFLLNKEFGVGTFFFFFLFNMFKMFFHFFCPQSFW